MIKTANPVDFFSTLLVAAIFLYFIKNFLTSSKSRGNSTKAQEEYLRSLIKTNNQFRAKQWSLEDWIQIYYKGRWDYYRASKLIKKLISENKEKQSTFKYLVENNFRRDKSHTIYASDFSAYGFCKNDFYFKYKGYLNKNLYELNDGNFFHGESLTETPIIKDRKIFFHDEIEGFKHVKWLKKSENEPIYNKEYNFSGLPDGILYFKDNTYSIIEVKSKSENYISKPFLGDILQLCSYALLYNNSKNLINLKMNQNMYLLYLTRKGKHKHLFKINYQTYKNQLFSTLENMKTIEYSKNLYLLNKNKCSACGFRNLCKKMNT